MKARVIATGDIVDVHRLCASSQGDIWQKKSGKEYFAHELDFDVKEPPKPRYNPDYWTRLEHQAAIVAMQGLVTRGEVLGSSVQEIARDIAEISCEVAHALVEKYKEKEK